MLADVAVQAAAAAETSSGVERAALYAAIATVIGSLTGAAVAIYTAHRNSDPAIRYLDEVTSHELPRALSDLLEDALEDARRARDETERAIRRAELWESRARKLGWDE